MLNIHLFISVGMTRFELATPRPPDAYSNRAELHPAVYAFFKATANIQLFLNKPAFAEEFIKCA